jgi:hypothetical protein
MLIRVQQLKNDVQFFLFKKSKYLNYLFFIFFSFSCSSIKYELIKTPHELNLDRKYAVIDYLKEEFSKKGITYQSIYFDKTTILKPASHFVLDSLYAIKLNLENKSKIDKQLEQKIVEQKLRIEKDTTPIYYILNHVFTTLEADNLITFHAKFTLSKTNEVQTMEIVNSYVIPKNLVRFFAYLSFNVSFMYPDSEIDEAELAFYEFYNEKLNTLEEKEKTKFLITMFSVMKIANETKNLDKTNLIEYMVLNYVQNTNVIAVTDNFIKIEEQYDEFSNMNYRVDYSYVDKTFGKTINVEVFLDPYLNLIEIVQKND